MSHKTRDIGTLASILLMQLVCYLPVLIPLVAIFKGSGLIIFGGMLLIAFGICGLITLFH